MYVDVTAADFDWRKTYKLFLGFINPRPIALVSTISPDGKPNVAPFSFYNMVSANPPVVMFCPSLGRNLDKKHTLLNIEGSGQFVVATVNDQIAQRMVRTGADLPYGESEFDFAPLTPQPATHVRPPLVSEAPVNIECKLRQIVSLGDKPGAGQMVLGNIVAVHIRDEFLTRGRDAIDPELLHTVGRLGGAMYCTVNEPYEMNIPKV